MQRAVKSDEFKRLLESDGFFLQRQAVIKYWFPFPFRRLALYICTISLSLCRLFWIILFVKSRINLPLLWNLLLPFYSLKILYCQIKISYTCVRQIFKHFAYDLLGLLVVNFRLWLFYLNVFVTKNAGMNASYQLTRTIVTKIHNQSITDDSFKLPNILICYFHLSVIHMNQLDIQTTFYLSIVIGIQSDLYIEPKNAHLINVSLCL